MPRFTLPILFYVIYLFPISSVVPAAAALIPIESRVRFSYETMEMPAPDAQMGLLGFHYLADVHPNLYVGIGGYGSVKGDRGGFLTGGLTGGIQKQLTSDLWFDAGLFIGAGGGGGAPQGDGLMLRPYAGLLYDFKAVRLSLAYSRIDFPDTDISSNNVAVALDLPFISYFSKDHSGSTISSLDELTVEPGQAPGFAQQEFLLKLSAYYPTESSYNTNGIKTGRRIDLVGVQFRHLISKKVYALVDVMGAFGGTADGYAEVLFGGGYRLPLTYDGKLRLNLNLAVGAGGGGKVDVGGGALARGEAGLEYRFSPNVFFALNGGYLDSITGSFAATCVSAELGFSLETLGSGFGFMPIKEEARLNWNRWRWRVSHITYTAPERKASVDDDKALHLLGLKVDHFLNDHIYLSGQAAGSYAGNAGGYAVGLIGLGIQSDQLLDTGLSLFSELLIGAAGGGGIDVGAGALWQPMAGLEYNFHDSISLQAMAGVIKAVDGNLYSPVLDVSLTWSFATLGRQIN